MPSSLGTRSGVPASLLSPVREALDNQDGGEVVVRHGRHIGRVFVYQGKIAWVACNSIPERLQDILIAEAGLSTTDIKAVLLECKQLGTSFAETVLAWGLADHATLNHCLLLHNARHFHGIVSLGENLSAMFVPQALHYSSDFLYSLGEVLGAFDGLPPAVVESTRETVGLSMNLEEMVREIPGAQFLAVVRLDDCALVGRWPADEEPDALRASLPGIRDTLVAPPILDRIDEVLVGVAFKKIPSTPGPITLLLGGDTMVVAKAVTSEHFVLMHCEGRSNMGRILSKSLTSLEVVFKKDEND